MGSLALPAFKRERTSGCQALCRDDRVCYFQAHKRGSDVATGGKVHDEQLGDLRELTVLLADDYFPALALPTKVHTNRPG